MPVGFDESPEEPVHLTPEIAERVVERFMERQAERERAEVAERERLAAVAKVQELAELLGTTPEDVRSLAREVRITRTEPEHRDAMSERESRKARPTWPIHLGYIALFAAFLAWGAIRGSQPATLDVPPGRYPYIRLADSPAAPVSALRFDPYIGGYTRDLGPFFMATPVNLLVDPSLKPPPPGLKVTLVTPLGKQTILGAVGATPDDAASAAQLRAAIRSLLAYEESRNQVEGVLPTVAYDKAPYDPGTMNWNGDATYVGWHQVEVTDGRRKFVGLLPDRRYAKDLPKFEEALRVRLERFVDTKFFPSRPPANLRPNTTEMRPPRPLPKGVALMVWNDNRTIWFRGAAPEAAPDLKDRLQAAVDVALRALPPTADPAAAPWVAAVYPGGEVYDRGPFVVGEAGTAQGVSLGVTRVAQRVREAIERTAKPPLNSVARHGSP